MFSWSYIILTFTEFDLNRILYSGLNHVSVSVKSSSNIEEFTIEGGNHQSNLTEMPDTGK